MVYNYSKEPQITNHKLQIQLSIFHWGNHPR